MSEVNASTVSWRPEGVRFGMVPETVLSNPALSSHAKTLYGVMAMLASFDTGELEKPLDAFATRMGVSVRTVQRAMKELVDAGQLIVEATFHEQFGKGWNRYQLIWDPLDVTPPADTGDTNPGDKGDSIPGDTGGTTSSDTLAVQTPSRSEYWDQLEGVFGYRARDAEAALWGRIINTVVDRGDPPQEIPRRAMVWAFHYDTPLTPSTLLHRWDWLGGRTANMSPANRKRLRQQLEQKAKEDAYWQSVKEKEDQLATR